MAETDSTPPENADGSASRVGAVVAQGEVPFAVLHDQRTIMARFRTTLESQGSGWVDAEVTRWTLTCDGRPFKVVAEDDREPPIDERWAGGDQTPLATVPDGERHLVRYHYYYAHHFGSVSGDVTLAFDLHAMTVTVDTDLEVDLD
ncbi:hypothetical protein [Actinomadura sp. HBU206391]|uniref:hypothetical protein n=1 Tax=Actinomadura sp. HBU206391 TaxID=2731692 RepID=UPI00165078E3|nr:hypothetical protein [Actinomadura sp. HBU206391]MBC6457081.1 hypothetical protein [Actinomadura sp. HBU206391]